MGFNDEERRILGLYPTTGSIGSKDNGISYFDRVLDILQSLFDYIDKI
jgi:hypothetical protein